MKTPIWEEAPGATRALLTPAGRGPRSFAMADQYTLTLVTGEVLRYTGGAVDIAYGGNTWTHGLVQVDDPRNKAVGHWKVGLDVDTWTVAMTPRYEDPATGVLWPDVIGSVPWLQAVRAGALDGAVVTVDRAYLAAWPNPLPPRVTPTGAYRIFVGRVATIDFGKTGAYVTINSHLELLGVSAPINLFQFGCRHTLFGAGCNNAGSLPASSFAVDSSVAAGSTRLAVKSTIAAPGGSGTYALGRIVFTSGLNNGLQNMIRFWDPVGKVMTLIDEMGFDVAVGDTFTAYPGCDKSQTSCLAFGNSINFGGQPFIPPPETSI